MLQNPMPMPIKNAPVAGHSGVAAGLQGQQHGAAGDQADAADRGGQPVGGADHQPARRDAANIQLTEAAPITNPGNARAVAPSRPAHRSADRAVTAI